MKTSLIALTLSLLISSVCHAQRGESGTRGGGGPVPLRKATLRALLEGANPPVKVKLKNLAEHAEEAFVPERFRKDYQDLVNREVNDSSGRVYKGLVGDLRSPYKIVDSSLVVPPADAPELCEANGVQVPASSGINRPGEEICFDVNLLEAQGTTLHELVGIAGHEHGWHLGILDHGHRLEQTVAALSARFDEQAIERVSTVPGIQPILSGICEYGISIGKSPKDSIEPEFDRGYIIIGKESGWLNRAVFKRPCGSTFEYFWAAGTRKPITGMLITYDINGIIVGTRETGVVVDGRRRYNGGLGQISGAEWETYLALTKK